jgi:outer membrane protein assembly factor BamA
MAKLTPYLKMHGLFVLMIFWGLAASAQYRLVLKGVDKDDAFISSLKLQRSFPNMQQCSSYVNRLPGVLNSKGFANASIDTIRFDSTSAYGELYIGAIQNNTIVYVDSSDTRLISQLGYSRKLSRPVNAAALQKLEENILDHLEDNGYPFAAVSLDVQRLESDTIFGKLVIDEGPLYKIDSIRNQGNASISDGYLQQYLGIHNGSIYRKQRLEVVTPKLRELPFLKETQPWNLTLLGTGSILNLYLEPKKSSEVNVLIGLLPANQQLKGGKMLITGDANINLKNALGNGETIGLNWQQIQVKSPRLNIFFQQPYIFRSPFGLNFNFDLFKKDSSFVNVGILLGASYAVSSSQGGSVFMQRLTTNLLSVDTFRVKTSRKLPSEADISSVNLGVTYDWVTTDYRFNPRRGNEWSITASAGTRNIRKNNAIIKLRDQQDPEFDYNRLYDTFALKSYQFRVKMKAARYFPLTRLSTVKASLSGGWFQSPAIFRNELFQIGGYKLLRGFDEESIFASAYAVFTTEYRYLIGQNSFLAAFTDYGIADNNSVVAKSQNSFFGAGVAMAFETKAGIFNITYAAGKRDDQKFNLRQSKIHLGYVNYF